MDESSFKPVDFSEQKAALLASLLGAEGTHREQERRIPRRANPDAYPLSAGQRRMWFLDQFEKGSHYNQDANLRLQGKVDVPVLERVLQEILRRHEATRSTFTLVDGQLVQRLVPIQPIKLPVISLREIPEPSREAEAMRLALEEAHKPFDLSKGPLWRFTLLSLAEDHYILLITAHHIAVDGWSATLFLREFRILYEAFQAGKPSPLSEPAVQFSDYAAWEKEWLESGAANQQRTYWQHRLAGAPPLLELPTDHPRPSIQTFRGARHYAILPKVLTTRLKTLSARERVTLFMTLLAAFDTLIKRYTERNDIVVGTPTANRTQPEVEGLIGFFVNTLAFRNDLSGDPTFRELLQRVRHTTLDALANQDLPFEQVVDALHPERTQAYTPLFQVLFVLQNVPRQPLELPGLSVSHFEIDNGTSKFDLSLYADEIPEGLSCNFEYNTDLFNADRIERMARHFGTLLEGVAENPGQRLSQLPLLPEAERRQLLVEWNDTNRVYPDSCVHELFGVQARRTPHSVAVMDEKTQLTYQELNTRANQLAHHLRGLGVGPEVLVGIGVERSVEMVVGLLGILKAGGAYVPLDPEHPKERLAFMARDTGLKVLLSQERLRTEWSWFQGQLVCLDSQWEAICQESPEDLQSGVEPNNLAYVIYTSGSTGVPKGVQISHRSLVNFLLSMQVKPGITANDTLLAVTTLSFDIASLEIYLPLSAGARVVLASRETAMDGRRLQERLLQSGTSVMQATPATWRLLVESGWEGGKDLKILCGGETLPRELARELITKSRSVWNMYGPTETTVWSTVFQITSADRPIPIGRPIANTEIYVLDTHLQPLPVGVAGELFIGGDGLARGYLDRPELTAEKFIPNPFSQNPGARLYRTGDLARYLPSGDIELLGRNDWQVKIRGFRIEPAEVEETLRRHPAVHEAVVTMREDTPGDKRLVAYYTGADGGEQGGTAGEVEALRRHLGRSLPEYMVPAAYVKLKAWPLTPAGKLDRKALPAPEGDSYVVRGYEAPQGEVETALASIWANVLRVERVGRHDDFFKLGGHSLLATQLISRVRGALGIDVPLRSLFERPTVAEFAQYVEAIRRVSGESTPLVRALDADHMEVEL